MKETSASHTIIKLSDVLDLDEAIDHGAMELVTITIRRKVKSEQLLTTMNTLYTLVATTNKQNCPLLIEFGYNSGVPKLIFCTARFENK